MSRNALDALVLGVVARLDFGLLRNKFLNPQLLNFLRIVRKQDLDIVSRVDEIVLFDAVSILIHIQLGERDLGNT